MYSSYRYRQDSKRLNHKGRILQRKTDYVIPCVDVIDDNLLKRYTSILLQQGFSVYPPGTSPPSPPEPGQQYIEHTDSTTFTFTTQGSSYVVNNLSNFATKMIDLCNSDNKRYCYKPFGFKFNNGAAPGSTYATFIFQTGETQSNTLNVIGKNGSANTTSETVCAWLIYDSNFQRYYIWFAGTEGVPTGQFDISVDDSDVNVGYYPVTPINNDFHPIFQIPDLNTMYMVFNNQTGHSIQYLEQPSHTNKVFTSDLLDDPFLFV